jgi:glycosyltransferase involved in cell wall biosynthesis
MRILLISTDPHEIGGESNYTRPLAAQFVKMGHVVHYFYSGASSRKYNWIFRTYTKKSRSDFPFGTAELINPPGWTFNFGHAMLDVSAPAAERVFARYVDRFRPDVVHMHSRFGLPASILAIGRKKGARVFNTVHAYGLICQRRVMIDNTGNLCPGPFSPQKCVLCTGAINVGKQKLMARLENTDPRLLKVASGLKKFVLGGPHHAGSADSTAINVDEGHANVQQMEERLRKIVNLMNSSVNLNICVSNDVKQVLMKVGVDERNLCVQHIGSTIAGTQKQNTSKIHNPIVIGNIGGVGYDKGTQVLVDAVAKLKASQFVVKIFGRFQQSFVDRITEGKKHLPIEFYGRYVPGDLPNILSEVDVIVLPSICNDTAPQTIFEAFSAGIPIVASRIGGFPDFITDGKNGFLFEAGNSAELAQRLDVLLNNHSLIEGFREAIPRLKTIEENASELIDLYMSR